MAKLANRPKLSAPPAAKTQLPPQQQRQQSTAAAHLYSTQEYDILKRKYSIQNKHLVTRNADLMSRITALEDQLSSTQIENLRLRNKEIKFNDKVRSHIHNLENKIISKFGELIYELDDFKIVMGLNKNENNHGFRRFDDLKKKKIDEIKLLNDKEYNNPYKKLINDKRRKSMLVRKNDAELQKDFQLDLSSKRNVDLVDFDIPEAENEEEEEDHITAKHEIKAKIKNIVDNIECEVKEPKKDVVGQSVNATECIQGKDLIEPAFEQDEFEDVEKSQDMEMDENNSIPTAISLETNTEPTTDTSENNTNNTSAKLDAEIHQRIIETPTYEESSNPVPIEKKVKSQSITKEKKQSIPRPLKNLSFKQPISWSQDSNLPGSTDPDPLSMSLSNDDESFRKRRRKSINYQLPSLRKKMRRESNDGFDDIMNYYASGSPNDSQAMGNNVTQRRRTNVGSKNRRKSSIGSGEQKKVRKVLGEVSQSEMNKNASATPPTFEIPSTGSVFEFNESDENAVVGLNESAKAKRKSLSREIKNRRHSIAL